MIARSQTIHPGIEVRRFSLDLDAEKLLALRATLSHEERARAGRFRFSRDADRFVAGRGLLRAALAERCDEPAEELVFGYGRAGKPFLPDHPHLRFNASGAGGVGLLALTEGSDVGVDLELIEAAAHVVKIADRFFAEAEIEELRSLEAHERPLASLRCWTRKEAYVKARGDGLGLALDEFAVSVAPDEPAALRWCATPGEAEQWSLRDVSDPGGEFVAALCHDGAPDMAVAVLGTR